MAVRFRCFRMVLNGEIESAEMGAPLRKSAATDRRRSGTAHVHLLGQRLSLCVCYTPIYSIQYTLVYTVYTL